MVSQTEDHAPESLWPKHLS